MRYGGVWREERREAEGGGGGRRESKRGLKGASKMGLKPMAVLANLTGLGSGVYSLAFMVGQSLVGGLGFKIPLFERAIERQIAVLRRRIPQKSWRPRLCRV